MSQKLLTPLELKIMNLLWQKKAAFVKELIADWPDDEVPKYNTVSTIIRILEEKGYVGHIAYGRSHQYYPLMSKIKYQQLLIQQVVEEAFSGSVSSLVSRLLDQPSISPEEIDEIRKLIDESEAP